MPVAGIVNLYKPAGVTSAKFVYRLRRVFNERRVGHAGSLDPFAEGVLIGCVGAATKLVEQLMELPKQYEASLRLGVTNPTHDPETPAEPVPGATPPARAQVDRALAARLGTHMQTPHAFSALKVAGMSAHELARRGKTPPLAERPVRIDAIHVLDYEWPVLKLRIDCGRGFYVRALARDLGEEWGCGAVCENLLRTRVGPFASTHAVDVNPANHAQVRNALLDMTAARKLLDATRCICADIQRSE